jgi:hypothetical protein
LPICGIGDIVFGSGTDKELPLNMMGEEEFTRKANDPAIKKAVATVRERWPASYFGNMDVDEVIGLAVWEARPIIQKRWSDEVQRLQTVLADIQAVVQASGDAELTRRVDAIVDLPEA